MLEKTMAELRQTALFSDLTADLRAIRNLGLVLATIDQVACNNGLGPDHNPSGQKIHLARDLAGDRHATGGSA